MATLRSTKRYMGLTHSQASALFGPAGPGQRCRLVADADGRAAFALDLGAGRARTVTPPEAAALLLEELLACATHALEGPPSGAVISVPAHFSEEAREATVRAGRAVGLEKVKLILEPVAAGLAYGISPKESQTVMVVDLGGGTLDVSLLEVGADAIEVLSSAGDPALGGDDWDAALATWLLEELPERAQRSDPASEFEAGLLRTARRARERLSNVSLVRIRVPGVSPNDAPLLSQATLDSLSTALYRRVREAVDRVSWQAGIDLNRRPLLIGVILVGGATRMPGIRRLLGNMTGLPILEAAVDPDQAVAAGAAIEAARLDGRLEGLAVMDEWRAALLRALTADNKDA
ncbi:hypothetical protein QBZ16_000250 [Prototheca wickerhamii]|uniref:Uncharacterized protein n=1 Tax=Prototheca wickerhamii TaxID=3111 RepID=A0AAD9IPP5_PROWI|nr:hypothetical protein QBZ16_000250 [Prototheca wickerhamii]